MSAERPAVLLMSERLSPHPVAAAAASAAIATDNSDGCLDFDKKTAPAGSKWLLPDKQQVVIDSSAIKLFCVPQAGMGAWVYQAWSERLAPHVKVRTGLPCQCCSGSALVQLLAQRMPARLACQTLIHWIDAMLSPGVSSRAARPWQPHEGASVDQPV